jgi:TM2 domain-containing membrane protein YozV
MKPKLIKGLFYLVLGFIGLFIIRLIYGYIAYPDGATSPLIQPDSGSSWRVSYEPKNYASAKRKFGSQETIAVEQKYEKIGTLKSKTIDFEGDEKKLRALIKKYEALIQFEQSSGLTGQRALKLAMGVIPNNFDAMIAEAKSIGKLTFIQIDKTDKTNEYKELKAERISLEKAREALSLLKGQGGRIEELIRLENQILDIENKIQALGVKLGEYDEEKEFCTVKFTLKEVRVAKREIPLSQRLIVAFEWTIKYYLGILAILFIGTLFILALLALVNIALVILDKLKWLPKIAESVVNENKG